LNIKENDHGLGVMDIAFSSSTVNPDAQDSNPEYQILIYPSAIEKLIGNDFNTLYALPANTTERMTAETMQPQLYTKLNNKTVNSHRAFEF
jgi:hypothetical protein